MMTPTPRAISSTRGAVAAGLLVLLTWLVVAIAPSAARADDFVTVAYSGTVDQTWVYDLGDPAFWQEKLHISFSERRTFRLVSTGYGRPTGPPQLQVDGTFRSDYAPPNDGRDCSFAIAPRPRLPDLMSVYWPSGETIEGTAFMPVHGTEVQAVGRSNPDPACDIQGSGGVGVSGVDPPNTTVVYEKALIANAVAKLGRGPVTRSFDADGTSADGRNTESIHTKLTVTNSDAPPSGGPSKPPRASYTPARTRAKVAALEALQDTYQRSLYPCGVGTGVGAALTAGGPVGLAVGGTMVAIGGPLCLRYLAAIRAEADTVADPPKRDYRTVARIAPTRVTARLPACPTAAGPGSPGAVCGALTPAAQRMLTTAAASTAAAVAIDTTISRQTAALRAKDTGAVRLQDRAMARLLRAFTSRRAAETKAASAVASILAGAGLNVPLAGPAADAAVKATNTRLARAGISAAKLTKVLRGAPSVTVPDLLAALRA